jgi:hypothetical protein
MRRFAYSSGYQLANCRTRVAFLERGATFLNEAFFLKHRHSSLLPYPWIRSCLLQLCANSGNILDQSDEVGNAKDKT